MNELNFNKQDTAVAVAIIGVSEAEQSFDLTMRKLESAFDAYEGAAGTAEFVQYVASNESEVTADVATAAKAMLIKDVAAAKIVNRESFAVRFESSETPAGDIVAVAEGAQALLKGAWESFIKLMKTAIYKVEKLTLKILAKVQGFKKDLEDLAKKFGKLDKTKLDQIDLDTKTIRSAKANFMFINGGDITGSGLHRITASIEDKKSDKKFISTLVEGIKDPSTITPVSLARAAHDAAIEEKSLALLPVDSNLIAFKNSNVMSEITLTPSRNDGRALSILAFAMKDGKPVAKYFREEASTESIKKARQHVAGDAPTVESIIALLKATKNIKDDIGVGEIKDIDKALEDLDKEFKDGFKGADSKFASEVGKKKMIIQAYASGATKFVRDSASYKYGMTKNVLTLANAIYKEYKSNSSKKGDKTSNESETPEIKISF